jgi:hypothetical protein
MCGLVPQPSVSAELPCAADGAFLHSGVAPHKECIAEHIPEFAEYSNLSNECQLTVYSTDVAAREALENHLRPPYARHMEQRPWCSERREPIIEFKQARYSYHEMMAWKAATEMAVLDMEPERVTSVLFCDAKLHVQVKNDAAERNLIRSLSDLGIPQDAFVVGPDVPNVRGTPTIGLPTLSDSNAGNVYLPVLLGADGKAGKLIIGRTDLRAATQILPACPGHGPPGEASTTLQKEPSVTTEHESAEINDSIQYAYIPAQAHMELGFNRKAQLVALTYLVDAGQEGLQELIEGISEIAPLERIYADDRIVFLAGETESVFVALGAERDWYDKPYRISVSYVHVSGPGHNN